MCCCALRAHFALVGLINPLQHASKPIRSSKVGAGIGFSNLMVGRMRSRKYRILDKGLRVNKQELLTDELLGTIMRSKSLDSFTSMTTPGKKDLVAFLNSKLEESGLKRPDVVHSANLNETYGYQIFKGARKPKRDKILALAFALGLSYHDTQLALSLGDVGNLYPKNRRDAIIIYCLDKKYSLSQADYELYRYGEETISDAGEGA